MKRVVFEPERGQRVPVWIWARDPAPEAVRQLQEIASRPYEEDLVTPVRRLEPIAVLKG